MRFLVTGEFLDAGPLLPPDKLVPIAENLILPSVAILAKWEKEGKSLGGGVHAGARKGSMVLEARDANEVDQMLMSLPFWGLLRWTVTPLVAFGERVQWESARIQEMKKQLGL